ncbi:MULTISPECIES: polysaccharide biosynthesis protein [unclassified Mesorhizobium]|uniref:polysaccharide biosynthesis protein n=1 Tax=unclassified Mesorhizobium TaxID=325217 RepID=UPI000FC9A75B|nr:MULTISPECIES: polysaccharide biosynthesis protein [unclassified Mesorhizobium]RUU82835.1 NAD-dependent epimerase/dehydratase family protein [Mesorhizobium sp. M7A.F.Ca.MR.362.00.0.0]RUV21043.1 NAD-dependent epimerase/dehydratase family protein [Mesorhizobium sp. M7A.F.Ca.MR.245.00.0.0]RUV51199.1 NAD-dependent epimerase/dehydratase family protein [Mesorhizobium sp. M7A.F.Ca.MR.228.00.0.0]RWN96433.1 MAG: NAD-dependent epimerase/dehydratase family protein [Mesorhizobium sp.]
MFSNKTLLITGGTGSFGNAVLARFLKTDFAEIRIFSRDEKKQEDMRLSLPDDRLKFYIGDVRDYHAVDDAVRGADYIFHAAALKQVPSCEFYPMEAIKTNVLGAENVLRAAISHRVQRCVVLSTDKAVYPVNAMGMSKALMEKVMIAKSRVSDSVRTIVCATRYGNVMASRGSVIPLFLDQLLRGKPLTVTDPNMTRFLMSLDESVDLVLYAFEHARSGDIFVQKAPASTVGVLAEALRELFQRDNPVKIIGTRHGEKLFESLVSREEMVRAEDLGNYYRIPADSRDLNYDKYFVEGERMVSELEDYTSHNTARLDVAQVKGLLSQLDIIKEALRA